MVEGLKEKIEEEEEERQMEKQKEDFCPCCGAGTLSYPDGWAERFFNPIFGWMECASCGTVFSPKSVRAVKVEQLSRIIKRPKLIVPV